MLHLVPFILCSFLGGWGGGAIIPFVAAEILLLDRSADSAVSAP